MIEILERFFRDVRSGIRSAMRSNLEKQQAAATTDVEHFPRLQRHNALHRVFQAFSDLFFAERLSAVAVYPNAEVQPRIVVCVMLFVTVDFVVYVLIL